MRLKVLTRAGALVFTAVLAACGGGGGGGGGGDAARNEGFWVGSNSSGKSGALVILANGELRSVVAAPFDPADDFAVAAARTYYGTVAFQQERFSGTGNSVAYEDPGSNRSSGPISGTLAGTTATATLSDGTTFNGAFRAAYDTPVAVASFQGTYRGRVQEADAASALTYPGTVTISADGSLRHDAGNCTTTGQIQPMAPGRQVASLEVTGTGICFDNSRRAGVVVLDTAVSPARLYIMTSTAAKVGGYSYVGVKN